LLALHEVVAVFTVDHEKLGIVCEVLADKSGVRVPAINCALNAQEQIMTEVDHGL
jgi:ribonuclease PH